MVTTYYCNLPWNLINLCFIVSPLKKLGHNIIRSLKMFVQFLPLFLFSLFIISGTYFTVNILNQFKFQYINIYQSVSWSNICKLKYTITYFNFF